MNLKSHHLGRWGIRKRNDKKLILNSRNELFKIKKDWPTNRYVSSLVAARSGAALTRPMSRSTPQLFLNTSGNKLGEEKLQANSPISKSASLSAGELSQGEKAMIHEKGDIVLTKVLGSPKEQWVKAVVEEVNHNKMTYDLSVLANEDRKKGLPSRKLTQMS